MGVNIELAKRLLKEQYFINGDNKIRTQNPIRVEVLAFIMQKYTDEQLKIPVVMPSFFKRRRLSLNLSMRDVTNETGISKATISRIERGYNAFFETVMALDKFYLAKLADKWRDSE